MQFIGIDIGSSSVKVSILNGETGDCLASSYSPKDEMIINSSFPGWAEQEPAEWYNNFKVALSECLKNDKVKKDKIAAIGISYQMHGLVVVDTNHEPVRPSIIWCDSRAVEIGEKAARDLGTDYCNSNLLNSPGNFTASKLAWLKMYEPENFKRSYKVMLPGDYIAMRLTGEITTTITGLTEGVFWDFREDRLSAKLMDYFGFSEELIPEIVPVFSPQGKLTPEAAADLGLNPETVVSYRAGDQPNNAFSVNVLNPGEIAATAGTSGVLYAITDTEISDTGNRVNTFTHVNYSSKKRNLGVLACINGTGILNSWVRRITGRTLAYADMNLLASKISPGSEGLTIYPFGNGAERLLQNRDPGASVQGLRFNIHNQDHIFRAVQESIAFSFRYAVDILKEMGISPSIIKAGNANLFLSPLFGTIFSSLTGTEVNLYNTDGSLGAARGAAFGVGYWDNINETFSKLKIVKSIEPDNELVKIYEDLYNNWKAGLDKHIKN